MARDRDREDGGWDDAPSGEQALVFLLGAAGGFAIGMLLSGRVSAPAGVGSRLRERAATAVRSFRPGRLRRELREQVALTRLEDAVLDAFLRDELLSERPIDVGAISRGIVELSGSVRNAAEADRAVRLARRVDGVETVVNRMDAEDELARRRRGGGTGAGGGRMAGEWTGREIGMGQRRQGHQTEPDQPDDSRQLRAESLEQADRAQFEDEDIAHSQPRVSSRPGHGDPREGLNFREDELDNQDPYGKHAVPAPEQPQALNADSRVGEGPKPGIELRLEAADLPVKPHGHNRPDTTDAGNQ
jgi:hypothetical protein